MDSGNSGSLQSSSGDEEFDSRADAISAFMNNPAAHVGPISNPRQAPPPQNTTCSSSMFDPLSNYFDPISRPASQQPLQSRPGSLLNLDVPWSKTLRSEPNCTEISALLASSSSSLQSLFGSQGQVAQHGSFTANQSPAVSIPPVPENTSATNTPRAASDQTHVVRNPKKRSRASRRAPTTVLTTDTTNFRAMVQEFTGIPGPPFTSSPFPRSRLDLYGPPSSMRSNPLEASQPPYLRRPFPQKVQLPPPPYLPLSSASLLSSSLIDHAIASPNTNNITAGLNINASPNPTASLNYQMPSELGLLKQPPPQSSTLLSMPNPILTSLLQSNTAKVQPSNPSIIGSKTSQGAMDIPSNDSHLKMGILDELGLSSHGQVNISTLSGLPGLISSDHQTTSRNDDNPVSWGNGVGSSDNNDQCQVRSGNGNFNFSRNASTGKLNYSASSSSFHGDKGSDKGNAARGEGMMESWICSSE